MQAHTHTHLHTFRPGVSGKAALGDYSRRDSISSTGKGDEEGISLRVHFVAIPLLERGTQQLPACCEYALIAVTQLLEKLR